MRSVVLCDDHEVVLRGLEMAVGQMRGLQVVGLCRTADQCFEVLGRTAADLVVVDLNFGRDDGVSLARHIKRRWPATKVVALTCRDDLPTVRAFLATGAEGYVLKDDRVDDFSQAVDRVLHGRSYLSPSLAAQLAQADPGDPDQRPTDEEREVLRLICRGFLNKQIAAELQISVSTVERRRASLMHKSGTRTSGELTVWATAQGWA